jgi:hypothetical protein
MWIAFILTIVNAVLHLPTATVLIHIVALLQTSWASGSFRSWCRRPVGS